MKHWVVDGCLRKGGDFVEGAVEITEEQYNYFLDNFELYNLENVNGQLRATIDVAAYRREALNTLTNPNFVVVNNVKYFDDELPYLSESYYLRSGGPCRITQEQMIRLVTERNRVYTMRRSAIQTAQTPQEVDGYLKCQTI